jgi:hypothetical protein
MAIRVGASRENDQPHPQGPHRRRATSASTARR